MKSLFYAFLGMLLWGIAPIFGKFGLKQVDASLALSMRSFIISIILMGWLLASGQFNALTTVSYQSWMLIGLEGICASLLGHLAYYYALKHGEVSIVSPVMAGFPLVAVLLGLFFLGEKLTLNKLVGSILIILGVLIIKR